MSALDRSTYIGSSDAAMVAGLSSWGSPLTVWNRLVGLEVDREPSLRMRIGKMIEPVILALYSERTGHAPERITDDEGPEVRSKVQPFIGCHVDFDHLETKTARSGYSWGEDEAVATVDEMVIPIAYFLQVQHQMFVMEWDSIEMAVLIGHDDFRTYRVPRDQRVIDGLVAAETEIWEMAQAGTPPAADDADSRRAYLRARFPRELTDSRPATPEDEMLVAAWRVSKRAFEDAKAAEKLAGDRLRNAIGHSAGFSGLVSWHAQSRTDIDRPTLTALLREIDRLDILAKSTKRTQFRVLRNLQSED